MSIHTILLQMESELEEYGDLHDENCGVNIEDECTCDMQGMKTFFKTFATRIVEEVGKELIGEDEDLSEDIKDVDYSLTLQQLDMEKVRLTVRKNIRNEFRAVQRTKLQKMKGDK